MEALNNRVALVTGVGRAAGIGFEVCRQLASQGITTLLTARRAEAAESLAGTLRDEGLDVRPYGLDVAEPDSVRQLTDRIQEDVGRLDILINNAAGTSAYGEQAATADLDQAHVVLETTLFGSWRLIQALLPLLRQSPAGRIVNVSSGAGSHGDPMFGLATNNQMGTSYAVSKAALNALTSKLALEEKESNVLINAVCPGFTATFEGGEAMGAQPVADGAAGIVWAALLDNDGPTGKFFRNKAELAW
ncbi:SDR family NAD(P)-dependent oxidoreductase [Fibrisoma montanum]|uniref:SDR family NAD(P)-dependent oxidoreductase n=1 Tax=Fibrisoma montanum TaxID=2305895 RepID=A0A418M2K2_9BACT|nr:SDR family NAD(P)-dependent oxidoreductase [Fibrisoma montanum]RIV19779.1 SDR family NAD(P)-dependent oxidoreductase [Fibrisoma montanum]